MQSNIGSIKPSRSAILRPLKADSKYLEITSLSRNLTQKEQIVELQNRIFDLMGQLEEEKRKGVYVQQQAERREQRFARKEVEFRKALKRYDDLFRELSGKDGEVGELTSKNLDRIGTMYRSIQTGLGEMQEKRIEEMRRQEEEIVRQFDERLREAEAQVEAETQRKLKQLGSKAEEDTKLGSQLELMKASVIMIEQKNTELERINRDLRVKCSLLDDEVKLLVSKNCALKKRSEISTQQPDLQLSAFQSLPNMETKTPNLDRPLFDLPDGRILDRQERIIIKLKRSLDHEKARLSAARSTYTRELAIRQDIRGLLKNCCDEVYNELMLAGENRSNMEVRAAVVKTLENQMRMLTLIYDRVFQTSDAPHKADFS